MIYKLLDYLINQLSDVFTGRANLPVTVKISGETSLPPKAQSVFYRVCQEALNNIAKHAEASRVEITFRNKISKATLCVNDNGRGFDTHKLHDHHYGLAMMRERAASIGATLIVNSRPGHGTQLLLSWNKTMEPAGGS